VKQSIKISSVAVNLLEKHIKNPELFRRMCCAEKSLAKNLFLNKDGAILWAMLFRQKEIKPKFSLPRNKKCVKYSKQRTI